MALFEDYEYDADEFVAYEEFDTSDLDLSSLELTEGQALEVMRILARYLVCQDLTVNGRLLEEDEILQIIINRANTLFNETYENIPEVNISNESIMSEAQDTYDESYDGEEYDFYTHLDHTRQAHYRKAIEQQNRIYNIQEEVNNHLMDEFAETYPELIEDIDSYLSINLYTKPIQKVNRA